MFFDWNKIYKKTDGSVGNLFLVIKMLAYKEVPRNFKDKIIPYYGKDYGGVSFLLCPETLMDNAFRYSYKEVVQYVALASYRKYADYLTSGDLTLPLVESPLDKIKIKQNRLLLLDEHDLIHFKYEKSHK
jgi:hypothetical protein